MSEENRCPTCGARLPAPGSKCPFCAEAQRLLQQLASTGEVRLCARCGALLEDDEVEYCRNCNRVPIQSPLRRDDRIARWLMERIEEPVPERKSIICPSCGQLLPAEAVYCANCDHRLTEEELRVIKGTTSAATWLAEAAPTETAPVAPRPSEVAAALPGGQVEQAEGATAEQTILPRGVTLDEGTAAQPPARPTPWQRLLAFFQEQLGEPEAAATKASAPPFWQQILGFLRALVQPARSGRSAQTLLWALLGLLALGLVGMAVFWAVLLRSGDVIFR